MRKTVMAGLTALCMLLGGSIAVCAASPNLPSFNGPSNPPSISLPEIDKSAADMSVYKQYGLTYNEAKSGYCYDGKLVGLFVDKQGRGISYLSQNGEVHIKVVRDSSGNLTGFVELSADEYNAIVSEMNANIADIEAQLEKDFAEMELPKPPKPDIQGGIAPSDLEQHMKEVGENLTQHMNEVNARLQQRMSELHASISER